MKKICKTCKKNIDIEDFTTDSRNKDGHGAHCRKCDNKKLRKFYNKNKDRINTNRRTEEYRSRHREATNIYNRRVGKKKYKIKKINATFEIKANNRIRILVCMAIMRNTSGHRVWQPLVGYNLLELKEHLESKFKPGMSWKNRSKWHIDHVIPVGCFEFNSYEDQGFKDCWALSNLQPLWAVENQRKGNNL